MKRVEELEKMKNTTETALGDARDAYANLEKKCEEIQNRNSELGVRISDIQSSNDELTGKHKEIVKENEILSETLAKANEERTQFERMYQESEGKSAQSILRISKLEKRIEKLKG